MIGLASAAALTEPADPPNEKFIAVACASETVKTVEATSTSPVVDICPPTDVVIAGVVEALTETDPIDAPAPMTMPRPSEMLDANTSLCTLAAFADWRLPPKVVVT